MNGSKVAYRYAKSLLEVAVDQKILENVYQDMNMVVSTLKENKDLADFLSSPVVKAKDKSEVTSKIFASKVTELTLNFLMLIIENGREEVFGQIVKRFIHLYDETKGIEVAKVITAISLTEELKNKIQALASKITGKNVELEQEIDQSLIGGYVLKIGDYQYDASVKNNMHRLHREFKENLYIPKL